MQADPLTPIVIVLAITVPIIAVFLALKAKQRKKVSEMATKASATEVKNSFGGRTFDGRFQDLEYNCRYFGGSKNSPPSFTITIKHPVPTPLTITRESGLDRLGKKIGLADELQTGDPAFDQAYYLNTEGKPLYRDFFSNRARREAVQGLFTAGYKVRHLAFVKDEVKVVISPFRRKDLDSFLLEPFLEKMAVLARALPAQALAPGASFGIVSETGMVRRNLAPALIAATIALQVLGIGVLIFGLIRYQPLGASLIWRSLPYSLPLWLLFLVLSFRLLKGRSSAHKTFLFLIFFGIFAFTVTGAGAMIFANGYLDRQPVIIHHLPVLDKYTTRNKNDTDYHLRIRHWNPRQETRRFEVSRSFFRDIQVGDQVDVAIKPGYFRQEWLVKLKKSDQ